MYIYSWCITYCKKRYHRAKQSERWVKEVEIPHGWLLSYFRFPWIVVAGNAKDAYIQMYVWRFAINIPVLSFCFCSKRLSRVFVEKNSITNILSPENWIFKKFSPGRQFQNFNFQKTWWDFSKSLDIYESFFLYVM
jgi:hypothetical protein